MMSIITSQVKHNWKYWPVFHRLNYDQPLSWISVYKNRSTQLKWTWIVWETVLFLGVHAGFQMCMCWASIYPVQSIIQWETTNRFRLHIYVYYNLLIPCTHSVNDEFSNVSCMYFTQRCVKEYRHLKENTHALMKRR